MSFVSYAQNFEDVMLWRALKHVRNGFYIDAGACWPDIDSVTRLFYEKGWRGINVEPNPEFHAQYATKRPEDFNLKTAIGDHEGHVIINCMRNCGLSTAVDEFAKQHEKAGWTSNKQEVPLSTLAVICDQYVKQGQDIHFLKVDVEGLEEAALRGNDWSKYRPWIVLAEATLPMTQIESYLGWEPILLDADYAFAYADGLNRFYVAKEHSELLDSFKYPPNVFDGFLLNAQQEAEAKAQQAEAKAQQAEAKAQQAEAKVQHLNDRWIEARNQSAQVRAQMQQTLDLLHTAQTQMQHAFDRADNAEAATEQLQQKLHSSTQDLTAVRQELHDVHQSNHQHLTQLEQSRKDLQDVHQANHHHWLQVQERDQQLAAMQASKSWRLTAPLRWCFGQARRLKAEGLVARLKALVKKVLRKLNHYLLARPALRQKLLRWSQQLGLYRTLKNWRDQLPDKPVLLAFPVDFEHTAVNVELSQLTPRAKKIYADLKHAIELEKGSR